MLINVKYYYTFLQIRKSVVSLQCISSVIHYANNAGNKHKYKRLGKNKENK